MKDWNSKSKNILQKSTYRLGLKTVNTNIIVNNTAIKDYGISFGISTPLLSSRSFSSIDLGVDLGKLGTIENDLIEDNYFRIYLGFSLESIFFFSNRENITDSYIIQYILVILRFNITI